ncbi:MAG: UDP-N-acetylmuramoyl-tripeptide--D-alanyl-D-alanine ligase [Rickettsiaceae bacterium]|nr:UDP-N-acetylmuramoyl-tripeptide--D-alanyl-D-alanine ligase [Rickettsiaceae bacterium]
MSHSWTSTELEIALGAELPRNIKANKVEFNSKDISAGDIFIAMTGGARDGHEFIPDALSNGAGLVISSKKIDDPRVVLVDDTAEALMKLANYKRNNSKAKFIAITGSAGKSSTKESTGFILSSFGKSYISRGSFNNHIGVPLTIASIPHDSDYATIELGMNAPGEIHNLTKIVKPDFAIITVIGEAHLEFLGTLENICRAKCEIFDGLQHGGKAIINLDSPYFELQKDILNNLGVQFYTFGTSRSADCVLTNFEQTDKENLAIYEVFGQKLETTNNLYGKHQSINLCIPLLLMHSLGLDLARASEIFPKIPSFGGRGLIHEVMINNHKIKIIDDAYNANPTSVRASLDTISSVKGAKIVILSDMKELGEKGPELHKELSSKLLETGASHFFAFGSLMKNLYDKVYHDIESEYFDKVSEEAFEKILSKISELDATILVKGSNSTKIRQFVDFAKSRSLAHPPEFEIFR